MSGRPKAFLMDRDIDPAYGISECWQTEDGKIFDVDFNIHVRQTMVCPYDMEHDRVESWEPLGVWHRDTTGGRAMRELGYEPVEEWDGDD